LEFDSSEDDLSLTATDLDESFVPDSMQEIYQLSNANRRRNKEKKKQKEGTSKSDSFDGTDEEDDEE
jgi:hypothetical protein